jgi:hypothetical protein
VTIALRRGERHATLVLSFTGVNGAAAPAVTGTVRMPR